VGLIFVFGRNLIEIGTACCLNFDEYLRLFSIIKERVRDKRTWGLAHQWIILASGAFGVCDGGHG
jgi:hypothetical protein